MKFATVREKFHETLTPRFDSSEADAFFYRLTEAYFGHNRLALALQPDLDVPPGEVDRLWDALVQLEAEKPIQYILNKADFYGLELYVDERVLIPRPETEELTDWIVRETRPLLHSSGALRILDIGTGSGCIAIALAKHLPGAAVYAMDNSGAALAVARKNAGKHQVSVNFVHADILHPPHFSGKFHIIVSNPPYISPSEKTQMKNNVLHYEPHTALFVPGTDPLLFYKKTAQWAVDNLQHNGLLYFEINQYLGEAVKTVLKADGFTGVMLKKDLSGNDRMIRCINNGINR